MEFIHRCAFKTKEGKLIWVRCSDTQLRCWRRDFQSMDPAWGLHVADEHFTVPGLRQKPATDQRIFCQQKFCQNTQITQIETSTINQYLLKCPHSHFFPENTSPAPILRPRYHKQTCTARSPLTMVPKKHIEMHQLQWQYQEQSGKVIIILIYIAKSRSN